MSVALCKFIPSSLNQLLFIRNLYRNADTDPGAFPDIGRNLEGLLRPERWEAWSR
ncbi:hypothetical protein SAMN05880555_1480 [Paenibacillus sp. RU4X]|nr:hypothetical protein SAMN05880555_1480 [Paenibacillus sp. RU4X]